MVLRQDLWTHDTCLVCQSIHSTQIEKEKHEQEEMHKKKIVVYDFLSRELSCLTPIDKLSVLYQRYYRANAAIGGLDCICELNFSWSEIPFWACTICNVAGRTVESADDHLYSSFHKRNYISEYDPDRYAILLRTQEKSSKNKHSLLEHEAILAILNKSNGLMQPDVYEFNERDREWALQKLGLTEEKEASPNYIVEDISDNHQIVLCKICGETFMAYKKEELFRQTWSTHISTKMHQRCQLMLTLIREESLEECKGLPPECDARTENNFEKKDNGTSASYGPTVGLEFLTMFAGSSESFCQLCFCSISNSNIIPHFSSEYHIERFMKRDGPSKLLNSEYLKIEEILEILIFCYEEKPITAHKYFRSAKQFPLLLKNYELPEHRSIIAYNMQEIDLGHNIRAIWCQDCKEYVQINDSESWNIHIFDEPHFEQASRKSLCYIGAEGLIRNNCNKLEDFQRSNQPIWAEEYSITLGVLTIQDHCEFGLQFIVIDKMRKKFYCTCCLVECDESDAQMFSFHARSIQHITKIMHSMNKKTMITLAFRFPDLSKRKPLIMDYLKHYKMDNREKQQSICVYDPVLACKLNCCGSLPKKLFDLALLAPEKRIEYIDEEIAKNTLQNYLFVPINIVMRLCKMQIECIEKESMVVRCEECRQGFSTTQSELKEHLTEHLLSSGHWERKKIFDENKFDDNYRLATKVSKIKVIPFQQLTTKKITWKWNDKKTSYEFVYAQLGLGDINERRNFCGQQKPDFFCSICAQNFKANRLDLEQHIRSFKHIFHFMEKEQPNIIPELQTELSNEALSIVDKHKNIRRLFAKALKGCEKKKPEDMPIFDFEENNCEYADISKALIEDGDIHNNSESAPIQQKNVIEIPNEADDDDQHNILDLSAIRFYRDKQNEDLTELFKYYKKIIEADKDQHNIKYDEPLKLINLDKIKRQLLNVVHFDGLMETEQQGTATTQGNSNIQTSDLQNTVDIPTNKEVETVTTIVSNHLIESLPPQGINKDNSNAHQASKPETHRGNKSNRARSKTRAQRSKSRSPIKRDRGHSPSPLDKRRERSKSSRRHRSRSPRHHSKTPLSSSRIRSKTRPIKEISKEKKQPMERSKESSPSRSTSSTTVTTKREPVVYTSYAKRLADLKASLLAKGGSKHILTGDPNLYVFQRKHIDKSKITEYIAKEATTHAKNIVPPKIHPPPPPFNEEIGGFFRYIPPAPPNYTQKNIGGAYDSNYLDKTYPHLLKKDVSPPRGNLEDLTSERVRKSSEYPSPTKFHHTSTSAISKQHSRSRSPEERKTRGKRSQNLEVDYRKEKKLKKREDNKYSSDEKSSNESSSEDSVALERSIKKQQLMNRFKEKQKETKKIQMQIPKELPALPAFKIQALRRKKAQVIAAKQMLKNKKNFSNDEMAKDEVEGMEAISEPEDIVQIELDDSPEKQKPQTSAVEDNQQTRRSSKWDETPTSKFVLIDGKFVPDDLTTQTTTNPKLGYLQETSKTIAIEPPRLMLPNAQQAQNILSSVAASTAAITAQKLKAGMLTTNMVANSNVLTQTLNQQQQTVLEKFPCSSTSVINTTPSAIPSRILSQTNIVEGISSISHSHPVLSVNPLPASILGTLTSALGVPPALLPSLSVPPPKLDQPPPPFMHPFQQQPSPNFIMHNKMRYYSDALEKIGNIKDFIEFMWREGYDPIPPTDPPLLFNEVLKKQRGMIGASTLYQIICYGHPELETYYCGMCNHWTTVSEMFAHLRAPMHQLNYMFRNYRKYHQKAMEEQDEQIRDMLLQRFALKIWELEHCGQCTNRIRCILNENAIAKFWPDYANFIDHSWKIMDDDDIEFLNINKSHSISAGPPEAYPQQSMELDMNKYGQQQQFINQPDSEMGKKSGLKTSGLVQMKSNFEEGQNEKGKNSQRMEKSDKESGKRLSRSPRKHSQGRKYRSKSRSPSNKSIKDKKNEKERQDSRRSRSRGGRSSKRSKSRSLTPKIKKKDKVEERQQNLDKTEEPADLGRRMAQFLHKIGDNRNASRIYWRNVHEETDNGNNPPIEVGPLTQSNILTIKTLANQIANSGESILRQHNEMGGKLPAQNVPIQGGQQLGKQGQLNAKFVEKQREMDDQKKMKRAIGATVELQQEYTKKGYISGEIFFATCQEFGILPGEVMQIAMLRDAAAAFNVDINGAYSTIIKGMRQREIMRPGTSNQPQTAPDHSTMNQTNTSQNNPQQPFNLQSMGVDPLKLRSFDHRMLQSLLTKANSAAALGIGTSQREEIKNPLIQRFEPQDICLDESLAPGNYVYPSYEENEQQQNLSSLDIDSNINMLTYAFSHQRKQQPPTVDSSAEVTLAVKASMRNSKPFGQEPEGMILPKHPKAFVRQAAPTAERGGQWIHESVKNMAAATPQMEHPNFVPSNIQEQPMDFSADIALSSGWQFEHKQMAGPSQPISASPSQQLPHPRPPIPQSSSSPAYRYPNPIGAPPFQGLNPANTPPNPNSTLTRLSTPTTPQLQKEQAQQKQINPKVQRLAMEIGNDWNSLGQFNLESLFGRGVGPNDVQRKGPAQEEKNRDKN